MTTDSSSRAAQEAVTAAPVLPRRCLRCRKPLTTQRLRANPHAALCVPCLLRIGDVPRIRRFDEFIGEEKFELYYTSDIEYMFGTQRNYVDISDDAINAALGDDQLLERVGNQVIAVTYGLPGEIEVDPPRSPYGRNRV